MDAKTIHITYSPHGPDLVLVFGDQRPLLLALAILGSEPRPQGGQLTLQLADLVVHDAQLLAVVKGLDLVCSDPVRNNDKMKYR